MTLKMLTFPYGHGGVGGGGGGGSTLLNGLVSWHGLEEASGTRADSEGSNDLTDNNTVTQVAGGGPGGQDCAQFTAANAESLSITDAAQTGLSPNNVDWTEQIWVLFDSLSDTRLITTKWVGTGNKREWLLMFDIGSGDFQVITYHDGTSGSANPLFAGITVAVDTWYRLLWKHDAANNQISLKVDDAAAVTAAQDASGIHVDTAPFVLGEHGEGGESYDGRMWGHGVWSRLTTDQEDTDLFNGGAGLAHPF